MSPAPFDSHQVVLNRINNSIFNYLATNPIGEIRIAPYDVHFSETNIFQPDLTFILNENLHQVQAKGLVGVPDMVIEVLSPGTASTHRGSKKQVYQRYGVKEYFLVNPATKQATRFLLQNGVFEKMADVTATISSAVLRTEIHF